MKNIKHNDYYNEKKGQQITMPIINNDENSSILYEKNIKIIDIRKDWYKLLQTIYNDLEIQIAMEKAYQDFQEGHKLKDFKYRNGVNGSWKFADIHIGRYPYTLSTTNWIYDYEKKEWLEQSNSVEKDAMNSIEKTIYKCSKVIGYAEIIDQLEKLRDKLYLRYPPRENQPETWRPQNASKWTAQWTKILAIKHYHNLTQDWRIISNSKHSTVAGFGKNNQIFIFDLTLITNINQDILNSFI